MAEKKYTKPGLIRIERFDKTEGLYMAEEHIHELARKAINEWLKITETPKSEYWTKGVPQHLFDYLDSWDREGAELAAVAFLEMRGYSVSEKKQEE